MKYVFFGSVIFLLIFLLVCIYIVTTVPKSPLRKSVMALLICVTVTMMIYGMALMTVNQTLALLFYALFYLGVDFMLIALEVYTRVYTDVCRNSKIINVITVISLLVDGFLLLMNIRIGNVFRVEALTDSFGNIYYNVVERYMLYNVHMVVCYIFAILAFLTLIYRFLHCPKVFRVNFRSLFISMILAMIVNVMFFQYGNVFDFSLIAYVLLSAAITYFSFFHVPAGLIEKILALFIKSIDDGVVCFDLKGKCIYANDRAKQILHAQKDENQIEKYLYTWLNGKDLKDAVDTSWKQTLIEEGKTYYFEIEYRNLEYKKHKLGSYIILHDHTEEVSRVERERYKANHDALTGIYNSRYFYEQTEKTLRENPDVSYYIVCSDIRDFKIVNDIYGEKKGDEILQKQADSLRDKSPEGCVYGRLSGDRFALCVPKELFNESLFRKEISRIELIEGNSNFRLRIYMGIYEVDNLDTPVSVMCDRAIMAIKTIKDDAASRIVYYDETFRKNALREQNIVSQFHDALESGQFCFYIQPQTSVDGSVHGGEALVRWIDPERGIVPPGEFIEIYERTGLISELDYYIWEKACIQLRDWRRQGHSDLYLSVNISPRDFYYMDIYKVFTELIQRHGIEAKNLHLEITETAIMSDMKKVIRLVKKLRQYGFRVEMDDFGSGYSSLNMLKDIRMDTIKLDMGFLRKTLNTERSMSIVKNVIQLSKKLGMEVVTEGVETKEQVDALREMGCDVFQGYYFAKPMSVWDYEDAYILLHAES